MRWFNPIRHEWNLDFATPQVGTLGIPGIGTFKNGRADYDYEPIAGRSVLAKFSIWKITDNTMQTKQAFSDDGGKTWEVNWINRYSRLKGSDQAFSSRRMPKRVVVPSLAAHVAIKSCGITPGIGEKTSILFHTPLHRGCDSMEKRWRRYAKKSR